MYSDGYSCTARGRFICPNGAWKSECQFPHYGDLYEYGPGDYKMALELALMGKIDLRSLITKVFPFERVTDAWETARKGEDIKALIPGLDFSGDVK